MKKEEWPQQDISGGDIQIQDTTVDMVVFITNSVLDRNKIETQLNPFNSFL